MERFVITVQSKASALFRAGSVLLSLIAIGLLVLAFAADGVAASWMAFAISGVLLGLAHHLHEESLASQRQGGSMHPWEPLS